jgi:hypothetical protein
MECHKDPCHSSCPNAEEDLVAYSCDWCGNEIYAGNDCYEFDSIHVCEECMDDCKCEAKEPDPPDDDYEQVRYKEMRQGIL